MVKIPETEGLKVFLDELQEGLNYLDTAIISLEENPDDTETLEEMFRVAHTIKGSAGFLDLQNLVSLGHAMEAVMLEFQTGALMVNRDIVDSLLQCKDAISNIGHALAAGEDAAEVQVDDLVARVESFLTGATPGVDGATPARPVSKGVKEVVPGTRLVRIWISRDEVVPSIRAFLVKKKLGDIAEIVKSDPAEEYLETDEFLAQKEKIVNYWVKSDAEDDEIRSVTRVDLIDRVEVLDEEAQQRAVDADRRKVEKPVDDARAEADVSNTVRIPVTRLDILLNLIGELVIANSGFIQIQDHLRVQPELDEVYRQVRDRTKELFRISADVQELVMKSRLVPIGQVFERFKRFIRDYSRRSGKDIKLQISGAETEIDKKIIDEMIKPLTHLVRNSLDHGLETPEERLSRNKPEQGMLRLSAFQEGNYINVSVEDDGRGMNYEDILQKAVTRGLVTVEESASLSESEILNFIFKSGFSTKSEADEISGRGIGMDVVKRSIDALNATMEIDSFPDAGTKINIKLPLTLAIINALIVRVGEELFSVPMASIIETQKIQRDHIITIEGNEMIKVRDSLISMIRLDHFFGTKSTLDEDIEEYPVIIVEFNDTLTAILVDDFIARQEMVIKSLSEHYRPIEGISGASIMGDGRIILILDVHGVIQLFREHKLESLYLEPIRLELSKKDIYIHESETGAVRLYTAPFGRKEDESGGGQVTVEEAAATAVAVEAPVEPTAEPEGEVLYGAPVEAPAPEEEVLYGVPSEEPATVEADQEELVATEGNIALIHQEFTEADVANLRQRMEDKDFLRVWLRLGNNKMVEGLQTLTGQGKVRVGASRAKWIEWTKLEAKIMKLEQTKRTLVDFSLPIMPIGGAVHLLLTHDNAVRLVNLMWEQANLPPSEDVSLEPLLEVSNILGSAYTNSLTELADVAVEPGLPSFVEGGAAISRQFQAQISGEMKNVLYIENRVYLGGEDFIAQVLIVLPEINR